MENKKFSKVAIKEGNPKWDNCIKRNSNIYKRPNDIRSEFERDYTRILHSTAYSRLKHKTQVFFATKNDHICTRIEHVNHVSSVSYSIANYLGLNTELTQAIATGHDIGHAPFGHAGESIISNFTQKNLKYKFWHEQNSLRFADFIETLPNTNNIETPLDLTYAVRDGIICHCGELDYSPLKPRNNRIDLNRDMSCSGEYNPYTWEGCIVKISDKISYLGRDIEDALRLKILSVSQLKKLCTISKQIVNSPIKEINNTVIMHSLLVSLCENSTIEDGLIMSKNYSKFIDDIKEFNYENIYKHYRINNFRNYAELVLNTILDTLSTAYNGKSTLKKLRDYKLIYPTLYIDFSNWLKKYTSDNNLKLYNIEVQEDYFQAIVDYVSGMTDNFAIKIFNEILQF